MTSISDRFKNTIFLLCCAILSVVGYGVVFAADATEGTAISQGFEVESGVDYTAGALVGVKSDAPRVVQLATAESAARAVGVVSDDPLLALSSGTSEVQITVNGTAVALVSNINGDVKAGDRIAPSPIAGVGMKATSDGQIVGTALSDFVADTAASQDITDQSGARHTVRIGKIPINVGVAYFVPEANTFVPPFLQRLADNIAGKQVSLIRIIFAVLVTLLAVGVIFVLVYSSVRSGIVAIGRNPLASGAVQLGLSKVALIAFVILAFVVMVDYLILRL
jgi:hypothetical protein